MSRRERWGWGVVALLLLLLARLPLHLATAALPVSNDDAIPLLMARAVLGGELSTILWNQPYNGTLDAYLLAPGVAVVSAHTAFRAYEIACGLALVAMAGLLAAAAAGERAGWIAAVLAAVGTPYMALMAALGPTPNFLVPLLVGAVVLAGYRLASGWTPAAATLLLVGLVAGVAIWDSFLALPALLGGTAGLALAGARPRLRALAWVAAGTAAGLVPLAIARAAGASGSTPVTAVRPRWLWGAGLRDLVRAAHGLFGIDVPLVVDGPERAALPTAATVVLAVALAAALLLGASRRRSLPLAGWAAALAVAFAFSRRTGGDEIRYLFGAALPVLALCAAGVAARLHGPPRRPLAWPMTAALLAGLVVPWMIGHRALLAAWRDPAHAAAVWQVPPLDAALERLGAAGIRSAYASLQFAGRLSVESDGAVVASQAWNERIPGDPLRFRDEVDLDPAPAWVLSPHLSRGMPRSAGFADAVEGMGGTFRQDPAGAVVVFHGFTPPYDEARPVPAAELSVRDMADEALPPAVVDRDPATRWAAPAAIARGSGLALTFAPRRRLSAVVLAVTLEPSPLGVPWIAEADGVVTARGPGRFGLQWVNGAPRAARQALMVVPLGDREVGDVRVIFQDAGPRLEIAEAFAYGPDERARPRAGAAASAEAYENARQGRWEDAARLYAEAVRLEPHRASHHAALSRARWRAAARRRLDVESLGDGGAPFVPRGGE